MVNDQNSLGYNSSLTWMNSLPKQTSGESAFLGLVVKDQVNCNLKKKKIFNLKFNIFL